MSRVDARIVGLRLGFQLLGPVAPGRAARFAERLFTRPPQHPLRPQEEAFLETGEAFTVDHDGQQLACWSWGSGPVVLLMHGWGSRAGRFRLFVPQLQQLGFRAVAFDGPGPWAHRRRRALPFPSSRRHCSRERRRRAR